MSIGIPLSQIISDKPKSIGSGYSNLDKELNGGFQKKNIYEIYGVPGINKTSMGLTICRNFNTNNPNEKILWIDVHGKVNINEIDDNEDLKSQLAYIRINNFSKLLFFIQNLKIEYSMIIIDGFSQLVVNHINVMLQRMSSNSKINIHDIKCKHLIIIFSLFTRYINMNNSILILLDDCMNTSFDSNKLNELDKPPEFNDNFLISMENKHRKNVQMLKSSLNANAALGYKDYKWEKFIKYRIGLFWNWKTSDVITNVNSSKKNDNLNNLNNNKLSQGVSLAHNGTTRGTIKCNKTVACALVTNLQNPNITKLVKLQYEENFKFHQKKRKLDISMSSYDFNTSSSDHTMIESSIVNSSTHFDETSVLFTQEEITHLSKEDEYVDDSEG